MGEETVKTEITYREFGKGKSQIGKSQQTHTIHIFVLFVRYSISRFL